MANVLEDSLAADLPCTIEEARALRELAIRSDVPIGGPDDTEEDLVVRLRDPLVFGAFAERVAADPGLAPSLRRRVVERAFDLLPLPIAEGDVILVPGRAPRHLLSLASHLQESQGFTVLQAMHLVYAVFLDRELLLEVPRSVRASVLNRLICDAEVPASLRALYAALHLSSVPEAEAHGTFRRLLGARSSPENVVKSLARLAVAPDGGRAMLAGLARSESLVSAGSDARPSASEVASVPRLPSRLAAPGRRWLLAHEGE